MTTRDDWLTSAISDDRMVADILLLLRLNPSSSFSPPPPPFPNTTFLPPPRWGFRLPRSRVPFPFPSDLSPEKKRDSVRKSPTTPLAWSTGDADASDESTLPLCGSRSEFVIADDPATPDASECKKNKTFVELKEGEVSLRKEKIHLKKEIATLHTTTFKERHVTNENLKRMKLDFDLNSTSGTTFAANVKDETASALDLIYWTYPSSQNALSFCKASMPVKERDCGFLLPDLNMTPSQDDFSSSYTV